MESKSKDDNYLLRTKNRGGQGESNMLIGLSFTKGNCLKSSNDRRRRRDLQTAIGASLILFAMTSLIQKGRLLSTYDPTIYARRRANNMMLADVPFLKGFEHVSVMVSLQKSHEKSQRKLIYYNPPDQFNLWQNSTILPEWMKNYLDWHKEQIQLLNETNFREYRFIIMFAGKGQKSGGLTDRLRPLPFFLRLASECNRIFLIHWDRPSHLEQYLLPPEQGLDWRVPEWLTRQLDSTTISPYANQRDVIRAAKSTLPQRRVQVCSYQSWNYGEIYYDQHLKRREADAKTVLRELWDIAFTPSPPVAAMIQDQYRQMGLVPGQYATAHIRAFFAFKDRDLDIIRKMTLNALNCTSQLRPGGPFYVASDSKFALNVALAYGEKMNATVVGRPHAHKHQPLHIGEHDVNGTRSSSNIENHTTIITVEDFYDTFVDLYLISMTRCVSFGKGGFGQWGLLIGRYNNTCHHTHTGNRWAQNCDWKEPETKSETAELQLSSQTVEQEELPRFRRPMKDKHHAYFF